MSDILCYQVDGPIATLTLNQPETLNAMDEPMAKAFSKLLFEIKKTKTLRVAILTGAGRAFSSGGNLQMIEKKTKKSQTVNKNELKIFYRSFLDVRTLSIPVIAAMNGPAIGAGFCLALACDLRYAAKSAKMGANFAKIGLAPGMGGIYLITRLVGATRAAELLMLGESVSANRAMNLGLLNGVFKDHELLSHVRGAAKVIAENAPLPIQMIKKGIQKTEQSTLEKMADYDAMSQATCFTSQDILEGIRAIQEKRNPLFFGK